MQVELTEKITDNQSLWDRDQSQTFAAGRNWILFLINLPLLAEVVRKYLYQQDSIFFGMATIVLLSILPFLFMPKTGVLKSLPLGIWMTIVALYSWAFTNQLVANHSLTMFFIGLGTMFLPLTYMLISNVYFQQGEGALYRVFLCVNGWLAVILAVSLIQIYLGRDHAFTTYGLGSTGIGDYSVSGRVVEGLFRPTSIFTHTGKFGQALFCLVLFKWCYLAAAKRPISWFWKVSISVDIFAVAVSGQRAAIVFLCTSAGLLFLYRVTREKSMTIARLLGYSFMGITAIAVVNLLPSLTVNDSLSLAFDRALSGFHDIPLRIEGNLILPLSTILDKYLLFGEGLGRFTLGARNYGGAVVYATVDMPGLGENSWIRILAEIGVIGTTLYLLMLLQLLRLALRSAVSRHPHENRVVALFFTLWLVSIMLWANTHDTFSNVIVASLAFALGGGILQRKHTMRT